ncbi:hypothetical protein ACFE04_004341 [Oxalis oulophora]
MSVEGKLFPHWVASLFRGSRTPQWVASRLRKGVQGTYMAITSELDGPNYCLLATNSGDQIWIEPEGEIEPQNLSSLRDLRGCDSKGYQNLLTFCRSSSGTSSKTLPDSSVPRYVRADVCLCHHTFEPLGVHKYAVDDVLVMSALFYPLGVLRYADDDVLVTYAEDDVLVMSACFYPLGVLRYAEDDVLVMSACFYPLGILRYAKDDVLMTSASFCPLGVLRYADDDVRQGDVLMTSTSFLPLGVLSLDAVAWNVLVPSLPIRALRLSGPVITKKTSSLVSCIDPSSMVTGILTFSPIWALDSVDQGCSDSEAYNNWTGVGDVNLKKIFLGGGEIGFVRPPAPGLHHTDGDGCDCSRGDSPLFGVQGTYMAIRSELDGPDYCLLATNSGDQIWIEPEGVLEIFVRLRSRRLNLRT